MPRASRVLYVDDDPTLLQLVVAQLEVRVSGMDVETVQSPTGLAAEPDRLSDVSCLLTGYELPGMTGVELLEAVREEHPDLPVVLYTARGSESVASDAISADVTEYVRKGSGEDHWDLLADRVRTAVEQYRATEQGDEARRERRRVLDRVTDWFLAIDADWRITEVNRQAIADYPGSREDYIGEDFREFVTTEVGEGNPFLATYEEAMETQEPKTVVAESETQSDTWLGVRAYPSEDGLSIFGRDVTERKRNERRLRTLHEATTSLEACESRGEVYDTAVTVATEVLAFDVCVLAVERDGSLVPAAVSDGVPADGVAETSIDEGLSGGTYPSGESCRLEDVSRHDDARPHGDYTSGLSLPVADVGVFQAVSEEPAAFDETDYELARLLVGHVVSALDRVDREEQLRQQNDLLDDFASMVSHDLKNGLMVADGRLDMAMDTTGPGATEQVEAARESLSRLEATVDDMLSYARQGKPVTDTEFVSLRPHVVDAWELVEDERATLVNDGDLRFEADPNRLRQLLENLLRNGVEHAGPDVRVEVGALGDGTGFYVADDGPGVDESDADLVFTRGYTNSTSGTGYGLSIVGEIAEAHGWTVSVTESREGGARFEVTDVVSF